MLIGDSPFLKEDDNKENQQGHIDSFISSERQEANEFIALVTWESLA